MVRIKWYLHPKQVKIEYIIYIMKVTEMKRVMLKVNKYHKQLWLELNNTYMLKK